MFRYIFIFHNLCVKCLTKGACFFQRISNFIDGSTYNVFLQILHKENSHFLFSQRNLTLNCFKVVSFHLLPLFLGRETCCYLSVSSIIRLQSFTLRHFNLSIEILCSDTKLFIYSKKKLHPLSFNTNIFSPPSEELLLNNVHILTTCIQIHNDVTFESSYSTVFYHIFL